MMRPALLPILAAALLIGCTPPPVRPDPPAYRATALQTAILTGRMFYINLPVYRR